MKNTSGSPFSANLFARAEHESHVLSLVGSPAYLILDGVKLKSCVVSPICPYPVGCRKAQPAAYPSVGPHQVILVLCRPPPAPGPASARVADGPCHPSECSLTSADHPTRRHPNGRTTQRPRRAMNILAPPQPPHRADGPGLPSPSSSSRRPSRPRRPSPRSSSCPGDPDRHLTQAASAALLSLTDNRKMASSHQGAIAPVFRDPRKPRISRSPVRGLRSIPCLRCRPGRPRRARPLSTARARLRADLVAMNVFLRDTRH